MIIGDIFPKNSIILGIMDWILFKNIYEQIQALFQKISLKRRFTNANYR